MKTERWFQQQALNNVAVLREAAEAAARQAMFNPMVMDGITVRFTGI